MHAKVDKKTTACTLDCPDACSIIAHVEKGQIVNLRGNPDHPITRGRLCPRPYVVRKMSASGDRLLYPTLRIKNSRRRISWDEALEIIAEKLHSLKRGISRGIFIQGHGSTGATKYAVRHFFRRLHFLEFHGSLCDEAGIEALIRDTGLLEMNDLREVLHARGIIIWGKSPSASSPHLASLIREAVSRGVPLVTISPEKLPLAYMAGLDIRIRPGGDLYLASLICRIIIEGKHFDHSIDKNSDNFKFFRDALTGAPVRRLTELADVTIEEARILADFLVEQRPVSILVGQGLQRYEQGHEAVRVINALAFLTGNIGRRGSGLYYNQPSSRNLDLSWMAKAGEESLSLPRVSRELSSSSGIDLAWIGAANLINQVPDSLKAREALRKIPFVVAMDAFVNDTVETADLALPASLMMERTEVVSSFGHDYLAYSPAVITPPGEARSDFEVIMEISRKIGSLLPWENLDQFFNGVLGSARLPGGLERLKKKGFLRARRPKVVYRGGKFPRPGGKFCFLTHLPFPKAEEEEFPFFLLSVVQSRYQHSQIPSEEQNEPLPVKINAARARELGLIPGSDVLLKSSLGMIPAVLQVDEDLHPEALVVPRGGWMKMGRGVNMIIEPLVTGVGHTAAYYQQKVNILPASL